MGGVLGAGDDGGAHLHVPTQDHLGRGLAVLLGESDEDGLLQKTFVAVAERVPRLDHRAVRREVGAQVALGVVGVALNGHELRLDAGDLDDLGDLVLREVGEAEGAHLARAVRLLHRAPRGQVVAYRLVQDEHVDVVEPQALERGVHRRHACVVDARPELGGDEDLAARDAALGDGTAHGALVHVGVGGVDVLVASRERGGCGRLGLDRGHEEGAQTFDGHLYVVIELQILHGLLLNGDFSNAMLRRLLTCEKFTLE